MNKKKLIVGLDVGTTKVCTLVAKKTDDGALEILGVGSHPSDGLRKGCVVNIEKTVQSIKNSVQEAKLMAGEEFDVVTVGIAGGHILSFNSSGVVPIKGQEVTLNDVHKVIEAAKAVVLPAEREILHVISQEFKVDNISGIKDPVGMSGIRLEAFVHIVTGKISQIQNLIKCVEMVGLVAEQVTLQPIASSESVLTMEEKNSGVVLVDIGGGTTDIAIWKEGSLIHSHVIPIGGNHFTNDLALALKISFNEAEKLKTEVGSVLICDEDNNHVVKLHGLSGTSAREVPLALINEILSARAEELFTLIKKVAVDSKSLNKITGGFILTGGGALIKGMATLGEYVLEFPTKTGRPMSFGGKMKNLEHPKYSTVLGLLYLSKVRLEQDLSKPKVFGIKGNLMEKIKESLRAVVKEIF
jgi:cell division protein FtsA